MAYDFDGSDDYIEATTAVVTGAPATLACWFNSDDILTNQTLLGLTDAVGNNRLFLEANGALGGKPVRARITVSGGSSNAQTSTGYTGNRWYHAAGVFASTTSRTAYIDGVAGTPNTATGTPLGLNKTAIGFINSASARVSIINGRLAEVGIWNAALTAQEIQSLAKGIKPINVRPESLVLYVPLVRDINDQIGGVALTSVGPVVAEHTRRYG